MSKCKIVKTIDDLVFDISEDLPLVMQDYIHKRLKDGSVWKNPVGFNISAIFSEQEIQNVMSWSNENRDKIFVGFRNYSGLGNYPNELNCSAVEHYFLSLPALYHWSFEPPWFWNGGQMSLTDAVEQKWLIRIGGSLMDEWLTNHWLKKDNIIAEQLREKVSR